MPQPFDPNTPHVLCAAAMGMRPELARRIASVTARWSVIEALQGSILAHLVHGDPAAVAALYTATTSAVAKRTAIVKVAETQGLSPDILKELAAIMEEVKNKGRERSAIIHGLWGVSDTYPTALIHCSSESWIRLHANTHDRRLYEGGTLEELSEKMDRVDVSNLDMRRYEDHDFTDLLRRIDELAARMRTVFRSLRPERYSLEALLGLADQPQSE